MAAEIGKQMLERNDELEEKLENLQENHSNLVEVSLCIRSVEDVSLRPSSPHMYGESSTVV